MRRVFLPVLAAALGAVVVSSASAMIHFDPAKMMRAADIRPGMIGECWTVLQGTQPAKFHVRIEGLLPQAILDKPEILFRVIDGPIVERNGPVMGGMSGSPVFVDGKLIGAVAYTVLYEKEPAGGITPIEAMIDGTTGTVRATKEAAVTAPITLDGRTYTRVADVGTVKPDGHTLFQERLAAPVYCTSGTPTINSWHSRLLGLFGLDAMPGASQHASIKVPMTPGDGFGVALATGDFLEYTFGTITWRQGNDLLGFGHPFLNAGKVSMPLTSVYINSFTPNYRRTDKDGSIMGTLGALTADSPWGVAGTLGEKAQTVPATYHICDDTTDRVKTFHVELVKNRLLTSSVCLDTLFDACGAVHFADGRPGVVKVRFRIKGSDGATVTRSDMYFHNGDYTSAVGGDMSEVMRLLVDNRFEPQKVVEVSADVHLRTEEDLARIERVYTEQQAAVAGKTLTVHVALKPVGKPEVVKSFTFKLPMALPKGAVMIGVSGGETAPDLRAQLSGFQPEFHSLGRVISYMESLEPNNDLVAMIAYPYQGAAVEDTPLPGLPENYRGRLTFGHRTGVRAIRDFSLQSVKMPFVVQGAYTTAVGTVTLQGDRGTPPSRKPKTEQSASVDPIAQVVNSVVRDTVPVMNWKTGEPFTAAALKAASSPSAASMVDDTDDQGDVADDDTADIDASSDTDPDTSATADKTKESKAAAKPKAGDGQVQAKLSEWTLSKYDELAKGVPDGLAVHTHGWLVPGPKFVHVADLPDPLIWDMAVQGKNIYVAAGLDAAIYKVTDGKVSPFYSMPKSIFVSCMTTLANGDLACALVPDATVTILGPDGKVKRSTKFDETYVWSLVPDGKDLLVATGRPARVYRLSPDGRKTLLAVIPETHVTALAVSPKGAKPQGIYAATADTGSIYLITPGGHVQQLYETPAGDISGLAVLADGTVVAAVTGRARIVALRPDGTVEDWYKNDKQKIWGLIADKNAVLVSLGPPGEIIRASGVDDWELVRSDHSQEIYAPFARRADGQLLVAGCGPGTILEQEMKPKSLVYTSESHDADLPAHWLNAAIDCSGDPAAMHLQTRTGASPAFEAGMWSAWSDATPSGQGFACTSPNNRYAQVRVTASPAKASQLRSLILRYEPQNRAPTLKVSAPTAASALSGKKDVKWTASDPDKDTVEIGLYLQGETDKTWKPLAEHQTTSPYSWDTTKTKDGIYRLRVVASDRPSRPVDPLEDVGLIAPIVVDNTKPTAKLTHDLKAAADGSVPVEILASDNLSGVAAVTWRYPDTELWYVAEPDGGQWGGKLLLCHFTLPKAIAGGSKIIVRTRDEAGNFVDLTLTMPGGKEAKPAAKPKPGKTPAKPAASKPAPAAGK